MILVISSKNTGLNWNILEKYWKILELYYSSSDVVVVVVVVVVLVLVTLTFLSVLSTGDSFCHRDNFCHCTELGLVHVLHVLEIDPKVAN